MAGKWKIRSSSVTRKIKRANNRTEKIKIEVIVWAIGGSKKEPHSYSVEVKRRSVRKDFTSGLENLGIALDVYKGYIQQAKYGSYDHLGM